MILKVTKSWSIVIEKESHLFSHKSLISFIIALPSSWSILKNFCSPTVPWPPPSFFQPSGAFTIFIIKMVVCQCVVSHKTGLQAHMYSTHCTTIKSIYTLYVNFTMKIFYHFSPGGESVLGWIESQERVAAAFVCPSWRSFLQSSHLPMTFWSLQQF